MSRPVSFHCAISRLFAGILVALALTACAAIPESQIPLSAPGHAYDERLVGDWYLHIGESPDKNGEQPLWVLRIQRTDAPTILSVQSFWFGGKPLSARSSVVEATAYASELDGRVYYNVQRIRNDDDYTTSEPPGYMLVYPEIDGDGLLSLLFLANDTLSRLAKADKIRTHAGGARIFTEGFGYTKLDLSIDELVALVRDTPHDELFSPNWNLSLSEFIRKYPDRKLPITFRRMSVTSFKS